jgi:hypothetical protein
MFQHLGPRWRLRNTFLDLVLVSLERIYKAVGLAAIFLGLLVRRVLGTLIRLRRVLLLFHIIKICETDLVAALERRVTFRWMTHLSVFCQNQLSLWYNLKINIIKFSLTISCYFFSYVD